MAEARTTDWVAVDARLRELAGQSAALDWEVGCALLLAWQTQAHERLGHASLFEYVERLFGYSPRVTAERLRVADALRDLPELEGALRRGERSWSAVRELTRVSVPETEEDWLAFSAGKTVRELEQAVSGLRPGDRPGDPPDPHLQRKIIRVDVSPEAWALYKDAITRLRRAADGPLTEEEALMELCRRTLDAAADPGGAPYQVALTICDHCGRTWQDAGGECVEVPLEVGERAACYAQNLGLVGAAPEEGDTHVGQRRPERPAPGEGSTHVGQRRASQTIPPATRREVHRRDRGRCRAPGCRNHTWLDLHHLSPRHEGGSHATSNLITLCGAHHALQHRGLLIIEGATEQEARFSHADGTPYGESPRPITVEASAEAYAALRSLGFGETESRQALAVARTHVGVTASTEELVAAALRLRQQRPARAA